MSVFLRGLETFDEYTFGISTAVKAARISKQANDSFGLVHFFVETTKRSIDGTGRVASLIKKADLCASVFSFQVDASITHFLQGASMAQMIAGIGLVASTLGLISETMAIYEQEKTIVCISELPASHVEEKDKKLLITAINNLKGLNYALFLRSLPDYLKAKIQKQDRENIFDQMINEVENDEPVHAHRLVKEIQTGALKKEFVHLLGIVGCVLGITASIALLIGCPMVGLIILITLGLVITVTSILLKKGWVENPQEGFNWKLCLPEFLQKKIQMDKEIEREMLNANTFMSQLHRNALQ